jgi:hypothetical protein
VTANASWFAGGFLFHNLLGQAMGRLVQQEADPDELNPDEPDQAPENSEDFHVIARKRLRAGAAFCTREVSVRRTVLTSLVSVPVDSIMALISSTDAMGGHLKTQQPMLLLMIEGPHCVLDSLQAGLANLQTSDSILSEVLAGWMELEPTPDARARARQYWGNEALFALMSLSAGVYARMELTYKSYPFKLWTVVNSPTPEVAAQIMRDPPCCKDAWFTQRLLGGQPLNSGILLRPETQSFLRDVASEMDTHIANVERQHASHKTNAARVKGKPATSFERVFHSSVLRQAMAQHLRTGRHDGRRVSRTMLAKRGLHQMALRASRARRLGSNPLMHFMKMRRAHTPGLARKDLIAEYRALPVDQLQHVKALFLADQARRGGQRAAPGSHQPALAMADSATHLGATGDQEWPISPAELASAMTDSRGRVQGLRTCSEAMRLQALGLMTVGAPQSAKAKAKAKAATPATHVGTRCMHLHAGVCSSTMDANKLLLVTQVSAQLDRWATATFGGADGLEGPGLAQRFIEVRVVREVRDDPHVPCVHPPPPTSRLFYVAWTRKAPCQMTVLAKLECNGVGKYSFSRSPNKGFYFLTSHSLAQQFLVHDDPAQLPNKLELIRPEVRQLATVCQVTVCHQHATVQSRMLWLVRSHCRQCVAHHKGVYATILGMLAGAHIRPQHR